MELDIESDEEDELSRPLVRNQVVFDIEADVRPPGERGSRDYHSDMPRAVQAARNRDVEDVWAEIG